MTKLEEDIYKHLLKKEGIDTCEEGNPITASICEGHAKAAAEVAKRYIEKAFYQSPACTVQTMCGTVTEEQLFEEFLQSEGITEQPGIVVSNGITSTE
jgi:hypothetical protein